MDAADEKADRIARAWDDKKRRWLESSLGRMHDTVLHAIIPYSAGGGLDLYYFPRGGRPGTAIATMELAESPRKGPSNDAFDRYEIVMFTRHPIDLGSTHDPSTDFGRAHMTIQPILNMIAPYAAQATLNPGETCEFPADVPDLGGRCMIFDAFASHTRSDGSTFGLLAIIEIHRSEMKFARKKGGAALIDRLKAAGHYPYSDLDRKPVAKAGWF